MENVDYDRIREKVEQIENACMGLYGSYTGMIKDVLFDDLNRFKQTLEEVERQRREIIERDQSSTY